MQLRHRLLALAALAGVIALVAALPALAGSSTKKATIVKVSVTKTTEFHFVVVPKTVKHGLITFTITNNGTLPHDFELCTSNKGGTADKCVGKKVPALISPGQTCKLTVNLTKAGTYEYLCTVPGHSAAGMKGILKVT